MVLFGVLTMILAIALLSLRIPAIDLYKNKLFQVITVSDCKELINLFTILSNRFIVIITLFFILNLTSLLSPTPLLNSVHLLTLNQFYW